MSKSEMRFFRRELISDYLQGFLPYARVPKMSSIKLFVRSAELWRYGQELKAYA